MGRGRYKLLILITVLCSHLSAIVMVSQANLLNHKLCVVKAKEGYLDDFWSSAIALMSGEPVNVIHLGDSHVQGGYFTTPIRDFFDTYFGIAGLGWVAPYSFFRTNQPYPSRFSRITGSWSGHFITRRSYGDSPSPTGVEMVALGNGVNEIEIKSGGNSPIKRVVIFRDATTPAISVRGATVSDTHSMSMVEMPVADTLSMGWQAANTVSLLAPKGAKWYGVSLETEESGIIVHTLGHNGAFFSTYNQFNFVSHLPLLRPKLLIVSLGTNDMLVSSFSIHDFARNVRSLISTLQKAMPEVAIVLTSPMPALKSVRTKGRTRRWQECREAALVAKILSQEAEYMGCAYIDLYRAFGGDKGAKVLMENGVISKDGIHLTKEGYMSIGKAISYALLEDFRGFLSRRKPLLFNVKTSS